MANDKCLLPAKLSVSLAQLLYSYLFRFRQQSYIDCSAQLLTILIKLRARINMCLEHSKKNRSCLISMENIFCLKDLQKAKDFGAQQETVLFSQEAAAGETRPTGTQA